MWYSGFFDNTLLFCHSQATFNVIVDGKLVDCSDPSSSNVVWTLGDCGGTVSKVILNVSLQTSDTDLCNEIMGIFFSECVNTPLRVSTFLQADAQLKAWTFTVLLNCHFLRTFQTVGISSWMDFEILFKASPAALVSISFILDPHFLRGAGGFWVFEERMKVDRNVQALSSSQVRKF